MHTTTTASPSGLRRALVGLPILAVAVSLAACSSSPGATATTSGAKTRTIAFIPGCTCDPYYSTEIAGFEAAAKAAGVTSLVQGAADFSAAAQIPVLQAIVQKKPDAIVIDPTDATALAAPIEAAIAAGIPVMTTGNNVNTKKIFTAIAASSIEGGKAGAQYIIDANPNGGEVVFVHIKPGISSIDDREKGFREVMSTNPKFTILNNLYSGADSATQTAGLVAPVIASHPNLVGIFASNVITAGGASNAVTAANKNGHITVIGYDAGPQEVTDLKAGALTALVSQDPAKIGKLAIENTLKYLNGDKSIPVDQPLKPLMIDAKNIDTPEAQSALYK